MPTLISEKTVVARKCHACSTCSDTAVQPGEKYSRQVYAYDGRVYAWKQCLPCEKMTSRVWDWWCMSGDGIGPDEYVDWACEHVDGPDHDVAYAYLVRVGLRGDGER